MRFALLPSHSQETGKTSASCGFFTQSYVFSMKNTVNRPTSWLPLVIPALQTGRLSLGAGWTIRIHFRTALAALQDHLQIKGVGEEKGERREGERERMESSKKGKAGAVRV